MYTIKLWRDGEYVPWTTAANPKVINMYLNLLEQLHPGIEYVIDHR